MANRAAAGTARVLSLRRETYAGPNFLPPYLCPIVVRGRNHRAAAVVALGELRHAFQTGVPGHAEPQGGEWSTSGRFAARQARGRAFAWETGSSTGSTQWSSRDRPVLSKARMT
jgi:hypothetical protein